MKNGRDKQRERERDRDRERERESKNLAVMIDRNIDKENIE
jgi:hypothetical protein